MSKNPVLKVSRFFLDLYDLYHAELESLSRQGDEENMGVLEKAIQERRMKCHEYLMLFMNDNPESAAVMFHGAFDFWTGPESKILQTLVACEDPLALPSNSRVFEEIIINSVGNQLLYSADIRPGGKKFILIAIGLEFLRTFGWSTTDHSLVPTEASDEEGEDEWKMGEAPEILGLDTVVIEDWLYLQF